MVTVLVFGREAVVIVGHDVELQLAHGFETIASALLEGLVGLAERELRRTLERKAVLGEIAAEEAHGRNLLEGIDIGGAETRNHIEVAAVGGDVGEEAGAVDPLAVGKDGVEVLPVGDREVEGLQAPVGRHIAEVDDADLVTDDVVFEVFLGEVLRFLSDGLDQWIDVIFAELAHNC